MTLPSAAASREPKHRRQIDVQVFLRGDGLWEADATLIDVKARDVLLGGAVRPAGQPVHDMLLRIVVDTRLNIVQAGSQTRGMPYPGECDRFAPAGDTEPAAIDPYTRLAGLNLLQDFHRALRQRTGGVLGCTHLTELAQVLPTAVVQAMAGEVLDTRGHGPDKPFQLDRCHALRGDREVVRVHHPRWYRARPDTLDPTPDARQPRESQTVQHPRRSEPGTTEPPT
jgi:hypothetical protein